MMATKDKTTKPSPKAIIVPKSLKPRIHIDEYLFTEHSDMTTIQASGFRAFVGDTVWMRLSEWKDEFVRFNNRKNRTQEEV